MKEKPLNDHLKAYYLEKKVPASLMNTLKNELGNEPSLDRRSSGWIGKVKRIDISSFFPSPKMLSLATVALCFVTLLYTFTSYKSFDSSVAALSQELGKEIAMNHKKRFAIEFPADTIALLQNQMDKLDFTLVPPAPLPRELSLVGGRYCSLHGNIAAQLQFTDSSGEYYTVYQTKLQPPLTSVLNQHLKHGDIELKMWGQQGVFLGMANTQIH